MNASGVTKLEGSLLELVEDGTLELDDFDDKTLSEASLISAGLVGVDELPDSNLVAADGSVSLHELVSTRVATLADLADVDLVVYEHLEASVKSSFASGLLAGIQSGELRARDFDNVPVSEQELVSSGLVTDDVLSSHGFHTREVGGVVVEARSTRICSP